VQICIFRKKSMKWNKLIEYSKKSYECAKFENIASFNSGRLHKKFRAQKEKKFKTLLSAMTRHSANPGSLPSANGGHSAKVTPGRAVSRRHSFAECQSLPSVRHSAKSLYTESFFLPRAALGKRWLCRVPDIWRSAKHLTLGNLAVCGSDQCITCRCSSFALP
jgi:hypothetical protein